MVAGEDAAEFHETVGRGVEDAEDRAFLLDGEGRVPQLTAEPPELERGGDRWRMAMPLQRADQPVDVVGGHVSTKQRVVRYRGDRIWGSS